MAEPVSVAVMLDNLATVEEEKTSPLNPKRFRECCDLFVAF